MLPVWCGGAISRVSELPYTSNLKKPLEYSLCLILQGGEEEEEEASHPTELEQQVKMKLIFQSFLYCCVLAAVAHSAELEINPEQKKRLSMWIESRLKRDLVSVEKTVASEHFVRPEDVRETLLPHSSSHIKIRTKRSSVNPSRRTGCSLGTCTVHDLAHRLHQLNNKLKIAPANKISPQGYGRRRRALPEHRVTLRLEAGKMKPVWRKADSQVHKFEALLRRT